MNSDNPNGNSKPSQVINGKHADLAVTKAAGGPKNPETDAVKSLEDEKAAAEVEGKDDELNQALEESFPASDPISQSSPTTSTQRDKNAKKDED